MRRTIVVCSLLMIAAPVALAAAAAAEAGPVVEVPATATTPPPVPAPAPPTTVLTTVEVPAAPAASPDALPQLNFFASVAGDELFGKVKASPTFTRMEKDLVGSPIQLRVTHSLQPTAGGQAAGLLSAIWAGSTLGLLPVVTNNNLVLTYEVRVNGKEVSHYEFQRSFTRAVNIWSNSNDRTYGLGDDGLEWLLSTADEFVAKAAQDPALRALRDEYTLYFGADAR